MRRGAASKGRDTSIALNVPESELASLAPETRALTLALSGPGSATGSAAGIVSSAGSATDRFDQAWWYALLLALLLLCAPTVLHDLFLMEYTGVRFYPLLYSLFSIVISWTLYRRTSATQEPAIPSEWKLTERESDVVSLVLEGLSNKEIGAKLFISANTVKTHLRAAFEKSGCRSRFALMSAVASARGPADESHKNSVI